MIENSPIITAIDVGTTKVCTVVGHRDTSKGIRVLGFSTVPCQGLRKGNVFDAGVTARSISKSLQEVQEQTGIDITSAFVGVSGSHLSFNNRWDRLPPGTHNGVITTEALERHQEGVVEPMSESNRRLIHAVKMSYRVDGLDDIRNPVGMHSEDVEVESHVVTGDSVLLDKLEQAVLRAGIDVQNLVLGPLASGIAVLTPEEKELGAVLLDIGGGTTDVVGFRKGRIHFSKVIPVGGWQFTNDIVVAFNTSFEAAEAAKLKYGTTDLHPVSTEEQISLPVADSDTETQVPRLDICQLIRERAHELARLVKISLDQMDVNLEDTAKVVLTGGTSDLPGLTSLMQRNLSIPVREGVPNPKGSIPQDLKAPPYATSVGILSWALSKHSLSHNESHNESHNGTKNTVEVAPLGFLSDLSGRFKKLKPAVLFAERNRRD